MVTVAGAVAVVPDPFRGVGAWQKTMEPQKPGTSLQGLYERVTKEFVAGQCRMRLEVSWDEWPRALHEGY